MPKKSIISIKSSRLFCLFSVYLAQNTNKCSVTPTNEENSGEYQMECPKAGDNRCSETATLYIEGTFLWVLIMRLHSEGKTRHKHASFTARRISESQRSSQQRTHSAKPLNRRSYIPLFFSFFYKKCKPRLQNINNPVTCT